MPGANGAPSSQTIGDSRALGNQGASSSLGTWLCIWEHLSHTPSTPTMPWCAWMPGPASALALCCWGHLAGTTSTASWPGASRCLRQSRLMLVMMGALVLHTISTSRALVRADASTSIGPCALCLGALGSHRISTSGALVLQGASSSLGTCLCF